MVRGKGMLDKTYQHIKENLHLVEVNLETGEVNKKISVHKSGYVRINLAGRITLLHQIVAIAGGLDPRGKTINHIDEDKANNSFSNLEVVSKNDNCNLAIKSGLIDYSKRSRKLDKQKVIEIKESSLSIYELAEIYGVHFTTISDVRRGKTWSHVEVNMK